MTGPSARDWRWSWHDRQSQVTCELSSLPQQIGTTKDLQTTYLWYLGNLFGDLGMISPYVVIKNFPFSSNWIMIYPKYPECPCHLGASLSHCRYFKGWWRSLDLLWKYRGPRQPSRPFCECAVTNVQLSETTGQQALSLDQTTQAVRSDQKEGLTNESEEWQEGGDTPFEWTASWRQSSAWLLEDGEHSDPGLRRARERSRSDVHVEGILNGLHWSTVVYIHFPWLL